MVSSSKPPNQKNKYGLKSILIYTSLWVLGIGLGLNNYFFMKRAVHTTGIILHSELYSKNGQWGGHYELDVQYTLLTGEKKTGHTKSKEEKWRENQIIKIVYDPQNPDNFKPDYFFDIWKYPIILIGFLVFITVLGGFQYVKARLFK